MSTALPADGSQALRGGSLGLGFIIFFVVSAAGPLIAIAGGVPIGIMLGNGAGMPALLLATVVTLLVFSVGYTTMARHVTSAGGFYAFIARGLGGHAGGAAAFVALLGYNAMQVGLYGMFGEVTSVFLSERLGWAVPWWACAYAAMASIAVFGYRQIDLSAKVLSLLVVGEYLVVLVLDFAILKSGGQAGINAVSFSQRTAFSGAPSIGLLFSFALFIGFEATTIYGEEAKNPRRTIPLATYISVLLIGGFYTFSVWCMVIGAGADTIVQTISSLKDPTTFVYSLSDRYAGKELTWMMSLLFMTSVYAGLLAFHNSAARYFFAAGREGLLPDRVGRTHPRHRSPHVGSLLQSSIALLAVTAFAVARADPVLTLFSWLTNVATVCVIALMTLASLAVVAFFSRVRSHGEPTLNVTALPALSGIVLGVVLVLAVSHFSLLTGASQAISYGLMALLPLFAIAGWLAARHLRRNDPVKYMQLGRSRG